MDRSTALETIRAARSNRGITYDDLAKKIGSKDATYLAAALHGQHRLNAEEAKKLADIVGVDIEAAMVTTAMPLRNEFPLTTDPFKYRLMELVGVYGDALRDRCQELFERVLFEHVLRSAGGNQLKAARLLGLNRNTVRKRGRELKLLPARPPRRPRVATD